MKIQLKDLYRQHVTIHNETETGNLRIEVRTIEDLNKVRITKPEDCDIITDISLPIEKVRLIHSFLQSVIEEYDA